MNPRNKENHSSRSLSKFRSWRSGSESKLWIYQKKSNNLQEQEKKNIKKHKAFSIDSSQDVLLPLRFSDSFPISRFDKNEIIFLHFLP
jgi:hypothetical protein